MSVTLGLSLLKSLLASSTSHWCSLPFHLAWRPPLSLPYPKNPLLPVLTAFGTFQFAYKTNRLTEDAVNAALHVALTSLEKPGTYTFLLFVDYSSAFNTIHPHHLVGKLVKLCLPYSTCHCIKNFLSKRPKSVRVDPAISSPITLSTVLPKDWVLSLLLFTLYTSDCIPNHIGNTFIKYETPPY